jgi:hypothetical protein
MSRPFRTLGENLEKWIEAVGDTSGIYQDEDQPASQLLNPPTATAERTERAELLFSMRNRFLRAIDCLRKRHFSRNPTIRPVCFPVFSSISAQLSLDNR